jgi:dATP pyrophosphohydrolase
MPSPWVGLDAFWQGVTGALEKDETIEQAARRELLEETGLSPSKIIEIGYVSIIRMQEEWIKNYPTGTKEIKEHAFTTFVSSDVTIKISDEHDMFEWVSLEKAIGMLKYKDNIEALVKSDKYFRENE